MFTYIYTYNLYLTLCSLCLVIMPSACDTLLACSSTVNNAIMLCIHDTKSLTCTACYIYDNHILRHFNSKEHSIMQMYVCKYVLRIYLNILCSCELIVLAITI